MRNTTKLFLLGLLLSSAHTSHAFADECIEGDTKDPVCVRDFYDPLDPDSNAQPINLYITYECVDGDWVAHESDGC